MLLRQLRIMRKQNKLSQQQISDVLGVSRSTYCSYETGRRDPDVEVLVKLSKFYNLPIDRMISDVNIEYLNDEDYYEGQPDTRYLSQLSKDEIDLIVKYRQLSNEEKKKVKDNMNK